MKKERLQTKQDDWVFFDGYSLDVRSTEKDVYTYFKQQQISSLKQQIVEFLLKERLSNYGYLYQSWKKIQRHRSKAKAILKLADINKLNWLELGNRFQVNKTAGDIRYIVCGSKNEEITNIMRRLIGLKGWVC